MAKAMGKRDAKDPMDFVTALVDLQKACGVDELKMSDYGITPRGVPPSSCPTPGAPWASSSSWTASSSAMRIW